MITYGFASELSGSSWFVTPAIKEGTTITCYDTSGYLGSWPLKEEGKFFPEEGGGVYCNKALKKANEYKGVV